MWMQSIILLAKAMIQTGNLPAAPVVDINHPGVALVTESEETWMMTMIFKMWSMTFPVELCTMNENM